MADIFISYKQERRAHAERLAVIMEAHGCEVWWDYHLEPRDKFRQVIQDEIDKSKAVVVLWCAESIKSTFVIDEADRALKQSKLIQAMLEDVEPPMGFRSVDQRLRITDWPGNADHDAITQLMNATKRLVRRRLRQPRTLLKALATGLGPLPAAVPASEDHKGILEAAEVASTNQSASNAQEHERELVYFKSCEGPTELAAYLNKYPDGHFAELARRKIETADRAWVAQLGLTDVDWSNKSGADLIAMLGPLASRAELESRARRNVPEALTLLGMVASDANSKETAAELYRTAAELGFPRAECTWAYCLANGDGVPKDEHKAVEFYLRSADAGIAIAQNNLGVMYARGRGVARDPKEAVKYYRKAVDQNNAMGQFNLGLAYELAAA